MRRAVLSLAAVLLLAGCGPDVLTGPAAEQAVRQAQGQTLAPGEEPLIVLDGKEITTEAARALRPESIASVEVIKGAAARTFYGERGRRGVIQITTKAAAPVPR